MLQKIQELFFTKVTSFIFSILRVLTVTAYVTVHLLELFFYSVTYWVWYP